MSRGFGDEDGENYAVSFFNSVLDSFENSGRICHHATAHHNGVGRPVSHPLTIGHEPFGWLRDP